MVDIKVLTVKPVGQGAGTIITFPTIRGSAVLFEDDVSSEKHSLCNGPVCTSTVGEVFVSDH